MTLYSHKDANIRKTWLLLTIFFVIVIGFGWGMSYIYNNPSILIIAVVFTIIMSFTSYWFSDKIVLKMAHAKPATRENARELYNVVENLCITAGIPVPKIYIINESSPNAFATGRDPKHAVIAVTAGLLKKLNRSELEGVVAHELSHIGNYDMLVSTMVVVLVGFISITSDMLLRSMFWGGSRNRNSSPVMMIIGLVLMILAPIAAIIIQMAISRKREFLADASAGLLTRYPEGLAKALIKISSDDTPLSVASNTTAHLWLDDPFKKKQKKSWFHKLFMTHPPIEERITALRSLNS
ncbi:M48 family metallopeptidase [Patescibacteria group bacterium]|nr:M48 family metallopeptidase [Patescibacteria group bacterium]